MCSIGEDDFGDEGGLHVMPSTDVKPANELSTICKKCKLKPAIVKLNFKDAQCEQCFLTYIRHKFCANLGTTKIVPRGAKIIVIFDGSASANVLLHLIRHVTTQGQFKRLQLSPTILLIDDSCLYDMSQSERRLHIGMVDEQAKQFGFPTFYINIASVIENPIRSDCAIRCYAEQMSTDKKFTTSLAALGSLSSRQDFVHCIRDKLIRRAAIYLECPFVFTSEICPDLAIKLLSNIALGRGSSVAQDVSFCDSRLGTVQIVRPIRDFDVVEVDTYVKVFRMRLLDEFDKRRYGFDADEFASIQNLTKGFVEDLQVNFQSTVSTVFRTGSKIATAASGSDLNSPQNLVQKCKLCTSYLDSSDSATLLAIEFSRCTSLQAGQSENGVSSATADQSSEAERDAQSMQSLCHGCRNIFIGLNDVSDDERNWGRDLYTFFNK